MQLRFLLLVAVASSTKAISTTAAANEGGPKLRAKDYPAPVAVAVEEINRRLRASDLDSPIEGTPHHSDWVKDPLDGQVFLEHLLHRALTNPEKMNRLFNQWYDEGRSAEEISFGLSRHASRDLEEAYENLRLNYAKFVEAKRFPQQSN